MRTVALGEVAKWGSGGTPKRGTAEFFGEGIPWLSIADLNDGIVMDARESLTPAGVANSAAKVVPAGTVFVAMYGSIGKLGIAGREMCTSQAIAFARPRSDRVELRYLFHYLLAQRPMLQALGRGGTQMNIGQADLKAWPIPLPELDEQRQIAAILDQADALRAKRRQVLAHLEDLTQSIFHGMFASVTSTKRLVASVAEFRYGTSSKSGKSGVPTLRIPNVIGGDIDTSEIKTVEVAAAELARLTLRDGDLLFVRTNGNPDHVGRCAVFTHDSVAETGHGRSPWIYASYLIRARLHHTLNPTFLANYLATPAGRKQLRDRSKTSAGQYNINVEGIGSVGIPVVEISQQLEFAARAEAVNAQRALVQRALAADDELFASLQLRAFRGEL